MNKTILGLLHGSCSLIARVLFSCALAAAAIGSCAGANQGPKPGSEPGSMLADSDANSAALLPDPVLRYDCGSDRFILLDDYITPELTVPAGEYTDGASRPAIAELLGVKRYDRSLPACIVHDYMYREGIASKKEADDLFALNLRRCRDQFSFPGLLIQPMVIAVRIGGRGSYAR